MKQALANPSRICSSSAVSASVRNLLDELGGEGWKLQNNNCNKKKLSHTVTPLGPCNASVIWSSLLSDLDTSKCIIHMRAKGKKKCSFPRWHVLNNREICFVCYPVTSKMSQMEVFPFSFHAQRINALVFKWQSTKRVAVDHLH